MQHNSGYIRIPVYQSELCGTEDQTISVFVVPDPPCQAERILQMLIKAELNISKHLRAKRNLLPMY